MMGLPFAASLRALRRPGTAFALPPPGLGRAVWDMARVWIPLALVNAVWTTQRALEAYGSIRSGAVSPHLLGWLGVDPADLRGMLAALPPPPALGRIWPWLILAVPLGVLGTWIHHAVWDHMALWLLGGLKARRGFRTSLLAEAEALKVTSVGTLIGLLGFVPVLGVALTLPLLLLDTYLWLFRGFALAARHGCEPWRGLAATALPAALLGCFALAVVSLAVVMARAAA